MKRYVSQDEQNLNARSSKLSADCIIRINIAIPFPRIMKSKKTFSQTFFYCKFKIINQLCNFMSYLHTMYSK